MQPVYGRGGGVPSAPAPQAFGGRGGGRPRFPRPEADDVLPPSRGPTDTLHVAISNVAYPVTDDMIRLVFGNVAPIRRVHIVPPAGGPHGTPNTTIVIVQFNDGAAAERALTERNGRHIYSGCNLMSISLTTWESFVPPAAVLPPPAQAPMPFVEGPYATPMPPMVGMVNPLAAPPPGMGAVPSMLSAPPGMHPLTPRLPGMLRGAPLQPFAPMGQQADVPARPFVSVAHYPEAVGLQGLFLLLECYGAVVSIRRNFRKPEIVTAKMASIADAEAVARNLNHVPFRDAKLNGRLFYNYHERSPCTDEGDPNSPSCTQHDFTTSMHRAPQYRAHCPPTNVFRITHCRSSSIEDVELFLADRGLRPMSVSKDEDLGVFVVTMESAEDAVAVLMSCQFDVCGEPKSNIIFIDPA